MACVALPASVMQASRLPRRLQWEPFELCHALSDSLAQAAPSASSTASSGHFLEAKPRGPGPGAAAAAAAAAALRGVLGRLEEAKEGLWSAALPASSGTYLATRDLISALLATDVLAQLLVFLDIFEFETRKDAMHVFAAVLQLGAPVGLKAEIVRHLEERPWIAAMLLEGCCKPDISLHCGHMLRACSLYPELVKFLLEERTALKLIDLAQHRSFDISSDAFASLRELTLVQKEVTAAYLSANFSEFFEAFNSLLLHEEYVTRRFALQLLGDIVEDPCFATALCSYVSNEQFLKLHMNLLRDTSAPIQLGAFRVLKAFLAQPAMPLRVHQILARNREQLARFFESFSAMADRCIRDDDIPIVEDLRSALQMLEALPRPISRGLRRCIVEAQVRDALAAVQ